MAAWEDCNAAGMNDSYGGGTAGRTSGNRKYWSQRERGYIPAGQVQDHGGHYTDAVTGERVYPHGQGGHAPIQH